MSPYQVAERWKFADGLFQVLLKEMAIDGVQNREGILFLLGRHHGSDAHVTHIVILRGERIVKKEDHLHIPAALMNEVTDHVVEQEGVLLGQVHSHGIGFAVDLSYPDHFYGIRVPGFLSIVVPDFGLRPDTRLEECGVHICEAPRGFRRMSNSEIGQRMGPLVGKSVIVLTAKV